MSKFDAKKKLLIAESEVYRQLLKLELQTLKIYTQRTQRRLTSLSTYLPFLKPLATRWFAGEKSKSPASSAKRISSLFLLGWKAYQRFSPYFGHKTSSPQESETTATAAEECLSKRL